MKDQNAKGVLVFIEQRHSEIMSVSLELIGKARELADTLGTKVMAVLIGCELESKANVLIEYGADEVLVLQSKDLELYSTEPYAQAFVYAIKTLNPEIVLIGATSIGRDLAPRISARIHTGLTADCTKLEIGKDNLLMMTRPAFGGNIMATIACPDFTPQMSTVRPGVMKAMDKDSSRKGEVKVEEFKVEKNKQCVEIISFTKSEKSEEDIQAASVLVSGGRGVGSEPEFSTLRDFAKAVGGTVSSSRAAVDSGWMPHDKQVGQTGKTVRPDFYFACGISGAIQHLAGMEESEFIIAINKDSDAPIFNVADLGLVGDLHKVLPLVTEEIKKIKEAKQTL